MARPIAGYALLAVGLGFALPPPAARAQADFGVDLVAMARAGGRPEECGGASRARASRWDRARTPGLGVYCDALARGYAALSTSPEAAVSNADAADAVLPGRAAPRVLAARAEVRRAAFPKAWEAFTRALSLSRKSLDAPGALHDYAVSALRTGRLPEALAAYRTLVPRAELLGDRREEVSVLVEAAVLAMSQGKTSLSEAIGYLTEARRRGPLPGLRDAVLGAFALSLERAGRSEEAEAILLEASGPAWLESERAAVVAGKASELPALVLGEVDAMIALLAERTDRELAIERWQSHLASDAGKASPFLAVARAHRDALAHGEKP